MALIDIKKEILPLKVHEHYGIEVLRAKERLVLNTNQKEIYIDLYSFAWAIGVNLNQLIEEICYSPITKEYLAFYRQDIKIIKVIDIKGLNNLIRNLMAAGYDFELLNTLRNQINKTIEQMEKE